MNDLNQGRSTPLPFAIKAEEVEDLVYSLGQALRYMQQDAPHAELIFNISQLEARVKDLETARRYTEERITRLNAVSMRHFQEKQVALLELKSVQAQPCVNCAHNYDEHDHEAQGRCLFNPGTKFWPKEPK